jgi:hypothetical protein
MTYFGLRDRSEAEIALRVNHALEPPLVCSVSQGLHAEHMLATSPCISARMWLLSPARHDRKREHHRHHYDHEKWEVEAVRHNLCCRNASECHCGCGVLFRWVSVPYAFGPN